MKRLIQAFVIIGTIGLTVAAFAADCAVCSRATSDRYWTKTGGQLTRGVANTGLGWTELVRQPVKEARGGGNVVIGMGKGVGHAVKRTGQGLVEIVMSPMPRQKDGKYLQVADDCPMCMYGGMPKK